MENPTFHIEGIVRSSNEMQDFTGPLSLILMLLSKNKIEIRDLKISDILEQYLEHVARIQEMDLDIASEFVQMASHLVYIKTRMLLVGDEEVSELEELMSSLEQLKCQDAYISIKAVTEEFLTASMQGALLFPKEPESLRVRGSREYEYRHEGNELLAALAAVFTRGGRQTLDSSQLLVPRRIIYSVRLKSLQLITLLREGKINTLRGLFELSESRSEIVATFISILELCAAGSLEITDGDGELTVRLCGDVSPDVVAEIDEATDESYSE